MGDNLLVYVTQNAAENLMTLYHEPEDQNVDDRGFGVCRVCCEWRKLTREHVPPRAAFNESPRLWQRMGSGGGENGVTEVPIQVRRGFYIRALCAACNGKSPHAQEFVRFAKSLAEKPVLFSSDGQRRLVHIEANTFLLAKQIAVMILAAEPVSFGKRHEDLRRFILQKAFVIRPAFKLFAFLVPYRPESGTVVRLQTRLDGSGEGFGLMAGEISSFPFGFVYGWEIGAGYRPENLTDITHWFLSDARQGRMESFDCRVTVIESLQAIYNGGRTTPQVDYIK